MKTLTQIIGITLISLLLISCASKNKPRDEELYFLDDTFFFEGIIKEKEEDGFLKKYNQAMFQFNDWTYRKVLSPVSRGYQFVMPDFAETGVKNFFENLGAVVRIPSGLLQGKWKYSAGEFGEAVINSLFSLGFAKIVDENPGNNEDLGQVLAFWGIPEGPTIIFPIIGPRSPLHLLGDVTSTYLNPVNITSGDNIFIPLKIEEELNNWPEKYEPYETLRDGSLDPFIGVIEAYEKNRKSQVKQ